MDFESVAAQLRKPEGEFGKQVGEKMNISNEIMNRTAIEWLHLAPADAVLEIGMGNGAFCKDILQPDATITYTGCDFSETMIAEATQRNQSFVEAGRAAFVLADAQAMPLADASFTKALTINTIYFWQNPAQVLAEIRRVLKPTGTLVIGLRTREVMQMLPFVLYGFQLYSEKEVESLLLNHGFNSIGIHKNQEPAQEIAGQLFSMDSVVVSGIRG